VPKPQKATVKWGLGEPPPPPLAGNAPRSATYGRSAPSNVVGISDERPDTDRRRVVRRQPASLSRTAGSTPSSSTVRSPGRSPPPRFTCSRRRQRAHARPGRKVGGGTLDQQRAPAHPVVTLIRSSCPPAGVNHAVICRECVHYLPVTYGGRNLGGVTTSAPFRMKPTDLGKPRLRGGCISNRSSSPSSAASCCARSR